MTYISTNMKEVVGFYLSTFNVQAQCLAESKTLIVCEYQDAPIDQSRSTAYATDQG